jgi:histidinol-phosphate aminotransferase
MISIPSRIATLKPYKPGASVKDIQAEFGVSNLVKLASNENPLGVSPLAQDAFKNSPFSVDLYPDGGASLCKVLGEKFKKPANQFIAANGSDALIHLILNTFLEPTDHLLAFEGTFVGLQVAAALYAKQSTFIPLDENYEMNVDALLTGVQQNTKIIYVANPNNPTGTFLTTPQLEQLISSVPKNILVIIDEAYFEFSQKLLGDAYPDSMNYEAENVITLRTFSKIYGLAGLRIGYAFSHSSIIATLMKVKLSFDPNMIAQEIAIAAIQDTDFVEKSANLVASEVPTLIASLRLQGWKVPNSAGNFVMIDCKTPEMAQNMYTALLSNGFIVRPLNGFGLPHCIRISIGMPEVNAQIIVALQSIRHQLVDSTYIHV